MSIDKFSTYRLSIIFLSLVVPATVFADCKLTDTDEKFEVVCFGKDPYVSSPSTASRPNGGKTIKARSEARSVIAMNEEEIRMMEKNNHYDSSRGKRTSGGKTREKKATGRLPPKT